MKKTIVSVVGISLIVLLSVLTSCKHEEGEPVSDCKVSGVTYENYVKYIIDDKCLGCHINNSLEPYQDNYSLIMVIVNDGRLKNVLTGSNGYQLMPYQTKGLPDCEVENIISWIDNGAPEQ
jgi:hypothetical protein